MRSLCLALIVSALALPGLPAFADSIDYDLNGTLLNGTFSGTVSFDQATGDLINANFFVSADGVFDTYTGLPGTIDMSPFYTGFTFTGSSGYEFLLALPTPNLIEYTGGELCSISALCLDNNYLAVSTAFAVDPNTSIDYAVDGQLTPQTALGEAPEPGTFLLLATGLVGIEWSRRYPSKD